ncbi:unnamed protein product [Trichogramma brassicae]|uniref:Period circadian protein n=1 Tax=Trichogramma brassicae TaxID=86971 RepID=A0A6H5HZH6_9HYME|nr:unnamed protein product [Trichogramma brassicae]
MERVRVALPFSKVGVDYAGPFHVRAFHGRGRTSVKSYIAVFVCFVTKAVHLELVFKCDAPSFIAALKRFISRRGYLAEIWSDCGTNFVGADAELRAMFAQESELVKGVIRFSTNRGIKWRFNPPGAPHFGGLWEAAVKSTKFHIRRVVGEAKLTSEEFETLLCQVEACLNSRPLTSLVDDSQDAQPLTPAHFLIGRASIIIAEPRLTEDCLSPCQRWQLVTQMVQHFWDRWSEEYIRQLQPRGKWRKDTPAPKVGDVVLIKYESTPPTAWPLARVTEVHPGKDGVVRVLTLKTATSTVRRPVVKYARLKILYPWTPSACRRFAISSRSARDRTWISDANRSTTETIPKLISNKKEKSHKKKKTKNIITTTALIESTQAPSSCTQAKPEPVTNAQITQQVFEPVKPIVEKKTEEQAVVELVDATDPGVHNDSNTSLPTTATDAAGLAAKINPIDESSSQFTVKPEETIIPTIFSTRHNATCHYTFVDQDVVQYMGYLPQDMINRSLFCYYHPEDLPLIKDIYETIINLEESSSFRSKPYRFIVHNGGCIVIDTEWSCFVNPWTKKLEFVVGSHRVLKGPVDPNVFSPFNRKNNALTNISEEVLKEARVIRKEIEDMLVQGVQMRFRPPNNDALLSKTNDFTTFVENVLQELRSPVPLKDHMAVDDRSFSGTRCPLLQEHDSIMLGEISPHHEYLDSNSSTETPPSYNQLNYNDTIERFFNSNVVVQGTKGPFASDSEEIAQSSANSSEELGKNNNTASRPDGRRNKDLKCAASSTNGSGNSGSNEMLSSESNNQQSFSGGTNSNATTSQTTTNNSSNNNNNDNKNKGFKPPLLTESILHKHDAEMETLMVQKHRELKKGDKIRNKSNDQKAKAAAAAAAAQSGEAPNNAANNKSSRLKRSASQTPDPEGNFKMAKYDETLKSSQQQQNNLGQAISTTNNAFANKANNRAGNLLSQPMPASLAAPAPPPPSATVNNQCFANANISPQATTRYPPGFFQMFPVYYMPVPAAAPIPREDPALGTAAAPQDHQQHHMGFPSTMNPAAPYCYVPMPCMPAPMSGLMYPPTAFASQHHRTHPFAAAAAAAGVYDRSQAVTMPEAVASTGNLNNMSASLAAVAPQAHRQQARLNPAQFLQAGQQLQQSQPQVQQPMQTPASTMSPFDDDSNSKKRPASRATSVKAEPGSSMAMSESSKKIFSPAGIVSSCLTDDGGGYVPTSSSRIDRDCQSNSSASQQLTNSSSFGLYQTTKSRESWTDNGTSNKSFGVTRKEPRWIEEVNLTTELIYQFQLGSRSLGSVLERDLEFLKSTKQPSLVNDQLGQLFIDLDLEGFGSKPILEEISSNNTPDTGSDLSQRAVHEGHKDYACDKCGKKFGRKENFLLHQKTVHEGRKDFACDKCEKKFGRKSNLLSHLKSVHQDYLCDKCAKRFGNKPSLLKHITMVHDDRKDFSRDKSKEKFRKQSHLLFHQNTVQEGRKYFKAFQDYLCDDCGKKFGLKHHLLSHQKIVHEGGKDYSCDDCHKKFVNQSNLQKHQKMVHECREDFICNECEKKFGQKSTLLSHQRSVHDGRKDYACDKCDKKFGYNSHLLSHQRTVHEGRKDYLCEKCAKRFGNKQRLLYHQKTIHEGRKDFVRDKCEEKFRLKSNSLTHQKIVHENRNDFECDKCEWKFRYKQNLIRHQKIIHEGRRDFACNKCEKKFGQKVHLITHQKNAHEGHKDFACDKIMKKNFQMSNTQINTKIVRVARIN